jgi:hypothetical protein
VRQRVIQLQEGIPIAIPNSVKFVHAWSTAVISATPYWAEDVCSELMARNVRVSAWLMILSFDTNARVDILSKRDFKPLNENSSNSLVLTDSSSGRHIERYFKEEELVEKMSVSPRIIGSRSRQSNRWRLDNVSRLI